MFRAFIDCSKGFVFVSLEFAKSRAQRAACLRALRARVSTIMFTNRENYERRRRN